MMVKSVLYWISFPLVLSLIFFYSGIFIYWGFLILGFLFFALVCFFIWFFRDPERIPDDKDGILSPADGKILPFRGDNKIRIFMSPFDVHVNRAPLYGEIIKQEYKKGGYKPAYSKDSDNNEQLKWVFETEAGTIEMVQIAGSLVRRIISYKKIGEKVQRGERVGVVKFGSRVDLTIPIGYNVIVKTGEHVYAGKTILAIKK
jgi:phosphatidylserine decarboxylase